MEHSNQSYISEFFLIGLTYAPDFESFIFTLFLSMYFVTVFGNILIILAVSFDSHLHTPMYFFIANLSFTDICISTTIIPKMLVNIQAQDQSISYTGCLLQVCFVLIFGGLESCLLAVMAYDRYLAIGHPLRYTVIMNPLLCVLLVLLSLLISTMNALLHSLMLLNLSFCTDQSIFHFFCELVQVIKLACSDTFINTLLIYTVTSVFAGVPLAGIIFSYIQIVSSILKISSVQGRKKAFSTCGSHLSVVCLFYGTAFGVYMSSAVSESSLKNVIFSMMYIVVPQILNPFIYSLRNREVKQAMRHLIFSVVL
ncbi:olfactory receptor 7G1-like [Cricetulus griseus]|uniref:Olfactory receptor n=1 Tax=Cricetulus griseus TaxID=10029 RepID=A0A8C2M9C3_CRIGR|nr:olfactory receptor 7G1-like [Cricetulus griseus]XP_027267443.1 olfactory receptor 7G1-like [Cricetulus griseus]